MALFKIKESKVSKLSIVEPRKERDIQGLFEENLLTILNVNFLATEYSTSFGGRIDTLGIDNNGSPVIIEYKRNQNDNVINQGLSYLKWLLDHKADFEILCRNKKINVEIEWNSPRVICVAETYIKFDLDTAEILPIKIELYRYRLYEDNILYLETESQKSVRISTAKIFEKVKGGASSAPSVFECVKDAAISFDAIDNLIVFDSAMKSEKLGNGVRDVVKE